MEFRLTIQMDNAAFEDNGHGAELAGILQGIRERVSGYGADVLLRMTPHALRDSNGDRVGEWSIR